VYKELFIYYFFREGKIMMIEKDSAGSMSSMLSAGYNIGKYTGTLAEKLQKARVDERQEMERAVHNIQNPAGQGNKLEHPVGIGGKLENISPSMTGKLDTEHTWDKQPYAVEISVQGREMQKQSNPDISKEGLEILKRVNPNISEDAIKNPAGLPDITSVDSAHYRWTKEDGIVEKMTVEEEIEMRKATAATAIHNNLSGHISDIIGQILKPYDTYEEAAYELYMKGYDNEWIGTDDELRVTWYLRNSEGNLPGRFGQFANALNNYLEVFGKDAEYFTKLDEALSKLEDGDNALVAEMRKMIAQVQSGNRINTNSEEFNEDVKTAVAKVYRQDEEERDAKPNKKKDAVQAQGKNGLSFDELRMMSLEEDKETLDKMIGRESEDSSKKDLGSLLDKNKKADETDGTKERIRQLNKDLLKDAEKEGSDPLIPTGKDAQEKEKHPIDPAEQKKQESIAASWKKIRDEYGWGPKPGTLSMDE